MKSKRIVSIIALLMVIAIVGTTLFFAFQSAFIFY